MLIPPDIDRRLLPPVLSDIRDVVGAEAMQKIVDADGGTRVLMPTLGQYRLGLRQLRRPPPSMPAVHRFVTRGSRVALASLHDRPNADAMMSDHARDAAEPPVIGACWTFP